MKHTKRAHLNETIIDFYFIHITLFKRIELNASEESMFWSRLHRLPNVAFSFRFTFLIIFNFLLSL